MSPLSHRGEIIEGHAPISLQMPRNGNTFSCDNECQILVSPFKRCSKLVSDLTLY